MLQHESHHINSLRSLCHLLICIHNFHNFHDWLRTFSSSSTRRASANSLSWQELCPMFPDVSRLTETRSALNEECSAWNSWHFVHQQLQALQHLIICIDMSSEFTCSPLLSLALLHAQGLPFCNPSPGQIKWNTMGPWSTGPVWLKLLDQSGPWACGYLFSSFEARQFRILIWSSLIFQCFNLSHGLKPFLVSQVGRTETESK